MAGTEKTDFLVIGSGIMGLTTALELQRVYPDCCITVLEKETQAGQHASGRNSGVLHAGFYYTADSLKARLTQEGNQALRRYCASKNIALNDCGKLVVTRNEAELESLHELHRRGQVNGVPLELISANDAAGIEPRARTVDEALFSPTTATVDPNAVMQSLQRDAINAGIRIRTNTAFLQYSNDKIVTTNGNFDAGYTVNTAGLYADKIARHFGFADHYTMLPFKGLYLYGTPAAGKLNCNIYPVPDVVNPFLGVHYTVTVDRQIKIGPTAIPAFWRENYKGFGNFNAGEFASIVALEARLFLKNRFNFRKLAFTELAKASRKKLITLAADMVSGIDGSSFAEWGKPGIRAQLLDTRDDSLVMDFCHEGDHRSLHVLNAVSPAFTCAFPLARLIVAEIDRLSH